MASTAVPHPVVTRNRVALARDIVALLDATPGLFAAGRPTSMAVAQFGPTVWSDIHRALSVDRPISGKVFSANTISVVVGLLAARES